MRVAILSDTRQPTLPVGGHGLGRMAYDIAGGMVARGIDTTLFAGPGSIAPEGVSPRLFADEYSRATELQMDRVLMSMYDIYIDLSHDHDLSRIAPEMRVINWLTDMECNYRPPNAVVGHWWQADRTPGARIVPLGIDVDAVPFQPNTLMSYLAFCAKIEPRKGADIASAVAVRAGIPLFVAGSNPLGATVEHYWGEIRDNAKLWGFLGGAYALLAPSRNDAGGRVLLDAAACGTPTLTTDQSGTQGHVEHGVSGFICADENELVDAVNDVRYLDRAKCRAWAVETHSLKAMIDGLLECADALGRGETW